MKTLRIGIAGYSRMKARTMAIARGEHKPARGEPTVWFTSVESFAKVLSQRNRALLTTIAREKPGSLTELAALAGRNKSNLSRTLKTMAQYGLVELKRGQRGTLIPRGPLQSGEPRPVVDLDPAPRRREAVGKGKATARLPQPLKGTRATLGSTSMPSTAQKLPRSW